MATASAERWRGPVFTGAKPYPAMLTSMRVLWAEDDPEVGEMVKETLEAEGYGADWVEDGEAALGLALVFPYDLLLLDVGLPRRDGLEVLAALREAGVRAPVLMLTARDGLEDRVRGLEGGADDYLVKPFHLAELRARVRALLRRAHGEASNEVAVGRLRLDLRGGGGPGGKRRNCDCRGGSSPSWSSWPCTRAVTTPASGCWNTSGPVKPTLTRAA